MTNFHEKPVHLCLGCGHDLHPAGDCEVATGYDHMNGDHFCGCGWHEGDDPDSEPGIDPFAKADDHPQGMTIDEYMQPTSTLTVEGQRIRIVRLDEQGRPVGEPFEVYGAVNFDPFPPER
jgi:hypothetical protein